jgi:nitroreductase
MASSLFVRLAVDSIPRPLASLLRGGRDKVRAWLEFQTDARRYLADCAPTDSRASTKLQGRQLECQLTKDYHRIEKGLALNAPKPKFGAEVMARLSLLIPHAVSTGPEEQYIDHASSALNALEQWHTVESIDDEVSPVVVSGDTFSLAPELLTNFFATRRSVRNFDPTRTIPLETLQNAANLAGTTPSVCNRQSWQAHVYSGEKAREILGHQNGNRGFADLVPQVAVITVDRRLFAGHSERNQRWVDGGLFAMNFVMALHGLGVNSCMLNWSMSNAQSDALRKSGGIHPSNDIIMLVAMGYAPADYRIARSPRRRLDEILNVH